MRRVLIILMFLWVVIPGSAQAESPSWCPVDVEPQEEKSPFIKVLIEGTVAPVDALPSPDGELVAYIHPERPSLWIASRDGSNPVEMVSYATLQTMREPEEEIPFVISIHHFAWIPDTYTLVLNTTQLPQTDGIYVFIADDLWTLDVETGDLTVALAQGEGGEFVLSPDGAYALIMQPENLYLYDFETGERREVAVEGYKAHGFGHDLLYPDVVWLEDAFITLTVTDPYSQHDAEVTVWRVPVEGDVETLGTFTAAYVSARLSPDGQLIAYWNVPEEGSNDRSLYISSLDGEESLLFLESELVDFVNWMPDSRYFRYREGDGEPAIGDVCGRK